MIKKIVRLCVRRVIGVREHETISDAIDRKKYAFLKRRNKNSFSVDDLRESLSSLGLKKGDTVIVHTAWRAFIGYDGNVDSIIKLIIDIVGKEGTIIMPSYTYDRNVFKYDDPSAAGYLTEVFRLKYSEVRSLDAVFSMCARGSKAKTIMDSQINSLYAFDKKSSYYMSVKNNAKILLMGLGKKPHKITLFHCVTYDLKNAVDCYKNVYNVKESVLIYDKNNKKIRKDIVGRDPRRQNNKRKFKRLFQILINKNNYKRINKLDLYLFESRGMYKTAREFIINNNYNLYK